jgi:hypothetical protein
MTAIVDDYAAISAALLDLGRPAVVTVPYEPDVFSGVFDSGVINCWPSVGKRPSADEITTLARRMCRVLTANEARLLEDRADVYVGVDLADVLGAMGYTVLTLDQADPLPGDPA